MASAVASSPAKTAKSSGSEAMSRAILPKSVEASFRPATRGISERRRIVSTSRSIAVRPGSLPTRIGRSVASAIAEKCRTRPSGLGRLYIGVTDRMPSALAAAASRAQKTARAVWLPPAPATTGTRPLAARTTAAVTALRSSRDNVADSPVVPQGTRKSTPATT